MSEESQTSKNDKNTSEDKDKNLNNNLNEEDDHIKKLRKEAASLRVKASELEKLKEKELAQKDADYIKIIEEKVTEVSSSYNQKLILSELKLEAYKAGIVDTDIIKIIDTSKVTLDKDGNILGISEAIESFKKEKPHLFQKSQNATGRTTYEKDPPKANSKNEILDATKLNKKEYDDLMRQTLKSNR